MATVSDKYILEKMKIGIPPTYTKEEREKEEEIERVGRALQYAQNVTLFVHSYQIRVDVQRAKNFIDSNIDIKIIKTSEDPRFGNKVTYNFKDKKDEKEKEEKKEEDSEETEIDFNKGFPGSVQNNEVVEGKSRQITVFCKEIDHHDFDAVR